MFGKFCKEEDCLNRVESVADREKPSQLHKSKGRLIVLFPSKPAEHGYCYYHYRVRYYAKFHEKVMEARRRANKNHRIQQQLIKLGGNPSSPSPVHIRR